MSELNQPNTSPANSGKPIPIGLHEASARGRQAWQRAWLRLTSITPAQLTRALLVAAILAFVVWLIVRAGSALLPFWVGLVLAYIALPFVNWLDRFVPRLLAVLILLGLETAVLTLAVVALAPIVARDVMHLVEAVPDVEMMRQWLDRGATWMQTLPPAAQEFLTSWLRTAYGNINENFGAFLLRFISAGAMRAFDAARWITFFFSFLVIPHWLVYVLKDQRGARQRVDETLPVAARADFWALLGIVERTARAFLRGRFAIALLGGLMLGVGLQLLPLLGLPAMPFPILVPLIVAICALVPIIGPIVGFVPLLAVALSVSWDLAGAAALVYVGVIVLAKILVLPRLEEWAVDIHPALLAPAVVLGSTFGFWGAVLAGPLAVVIRDLFRYIYGRLDDPPRPAGLLPDAKPEPARVGAATAQPVPLRRPRPLAGERP